MMLYCISRIIVDEDYGDNKDNGKFRLERVKMSDA